VSSLGSEALQSNINKNVTATIGETNVELWCSYIIALLDSSVGLVRDTRSVKYSPVNVALRLSSGG
jgi:hypothetical protein